MKGSLKAICGVLCLLTMLCGCGSNKSYDNDAASYEEKVNLIVYFNDVSGKLPVPQWVKGDTYINIEESVIRELIKGPSSGVLKPVLPAGAKLLWVKVRNGTAQVNFNSAFKGSTKGDPDTSHMGVVCVVNSLTILPHISNVQFLIDGRDWGKPFKRIREAIIRENLSPSEVMRRQMSFEKRGDMLNAYLLMSDRESTEGRKSFDEYIREMEEARAEGLMDVDFGVSEYIIDKKDENRAVVKVNFISRDSGGNYVKGPDILFDTVKVDGYWMVDWISDN